MLFEALEEWRFPPYEFTSGLPITQFIFRWLMNISWLSVKVHPNAGKDVLIALGPGRFEAWVKTKPMQGDANESVACLIARVLKVSRERVRLIKGRRGYHKVFKIFG